MIEQIGQDLVNYLNSTNSWLTVAGVGYKHDNGIVSLDGKYMGLNDTRGKHTGYVRFDDREDETYTELSKPISSRGNERMASAPLVLVIMTSTVKSRRMIGDKLISDLMKFPDQTLNRVRSVDIMSSSCNTNLIYKEETAEKGDEGRNIRSNEHGLVRIKFALKYLKTWNNCNTYNPNEC